MKNLNFLLNKLWVWIVLVVLFAIPAFTTLFQPGYFTMHDDLQVMRVFEMDLCFKDGQIPCRWVPDMGYGYGYPLFNYYPVMPYYLTEIIYKVVALLHPLTALIWTVKIAFILSFIVSGVTMFLLARKFWGNWGGFVSAMFFIYAPYHSVDVYVRGAMAEAWSLSWTPAVFLMIYLVIKKASLKNIALLAIFVALFLTSHNPMALVFSPIMILWGLILIWQEKAYRNFPKLAAAGLWGLGLAAFFSLPVLLEGKYVHLETLFEGYFNYLAHFVTINQLFISRFWGYGPSVWGPNDGLSFQIGWLHWGAVVLATVEAVLFWKKKRNLSFILLFVIAAFWFYAFLMHSRSNPIWERVSILQNIQFPWRLLGVTAFLSSFVAGSFIAVEPIKNYLKISFVMVAVAGLFFLYQQPYFHIEKPIPLTDQEKLSGALWDLQRAAGIFDYLPKTAKFPPGSPVTEGIEIRSGSATISDLQKGTDWLSFKSESTTDAQLRLPIIDFPIWKVFVDSREIQFDNKNDLGQPTFNVSPGDHQVSARLFDTPLRTAANLISLISFLILAVVLILIFKKKRS